MLDRATAPETSGVQHIDVSNQNQGQSETTFRAGVHDLHHVQWIRGINRLSLQILRSHLWKSLQVMGHLTLPSHGSEYLAPFYQRLLQVCVRLYSLASEFRPVFVH